MNEIPFNAELTPQEQDLKNLFHLSFFYSQGDIDLQLEYFEWMLRNDLLPQEVFSNPTPPYFIERIKPPKKHFQTAKRDQLSTIKEVWSNIHDIPIGMEEEKTQQTLRKDMLSKIISLDIHYSTRKPRPRRMQKKDTPYDSINDRRASMFRHYVLQKHPTGHRNFDLLFDDLRNSLTDPSIENDHKIQDAIKRLGIHWENFHPDGKFFY